MDAKKNQTAAPGTKERPDECVDRAHGNHKQAGDALGNTMKAIVQDKYGSADVLAFKEIERPEVGDNDALVRICAAGLDRGVWHLMTGLPYLVRLGFGLRAPKNPVLGLDAAGIIEAVGKNVTGFQIGDEVFGFCSGSFAEYVCVSQEKLALKPPNLTFEQAAAVPSSAGTALQGLSDQGELTTGQRVLITGASGGVGTFAVQIAKAIGAEVTGVCSTTKIDMVLSIGADSVIDYKRGDFTQTAHRYDVILDIAGNCPLSALRRILTPSGTLVLIGGEKGGRWLGGIDRGLRALALSPFVKHNLRMFILSQNKKHLHKLAKFIEAGVVTPVIDKTFPLSNVPEAMQYLIDGHARVKIVISI